MPRQKYTILPLAGSIEIDVPRKVIKILDGNKSKIIDTITKKGNITGIGKNGKKNIILHPVDEIEPKVVKKGLCIDASPKERRKYIQRINNEVKYIYENKEQREKRIKERDKKKNKPTIIVGKTSKPKSVLRN